MESIRHFDQMSFEERMALISMLEYVKQSLDNPEPKEAKWLEIVIRSLEEKAGIQVDRRIN